ncbi:TetR/AcrR family transcriptional regulator [Agromyces archimandritae]|uniref:TetR family transcriptional regulator n=1 Tax=Agromyces archimandritae TaxID=2781962 RepID=A0A975IMX5_9MICO|nr:TetR/AcrR family transcriptional regulator [Agromyces archimandritae]QTX03935.1 TetR family transcriptional regulator [Agromyces archimandritae]
MPKVSDAYRARRRDEILDAAQRCFSRGGYRGTTMADIIAESGLSAGAIYGHFSGKHELFAAMSRRTLGQRFAELDSLGSDGRPLAPAEVMRSVMTGMRDHFDLRILIQLWADAAIHADVRAEIAGPIGAIREAFGTAVRPWFEAHPEHVVDGDVDATIAALMPIALSLGQGFVLQREIFDDFDDEAYFAQAARLLPH